MPIITIGSQVIDFVVNPKVIPSYMIYGLLDPETNDLKYIGKTVIGKKRLEAHWSPKSIKNDGHTRKGNWLRKLKNSNTKFNYIILFSLDSNLSREEANKILTKKEIELIADFTKIYDLVNGTKGGEGATGRIVTEESRKKMSDSAKKYFLNNKDNSPIVKFQKPLIEDKSTCSGILRWCSKCSEWKEIYNFKKVSNSLRRSRQCHKCLHTARKEYKARIKKENIKKEYGKSVKAINEITGEEKLFTSRKKAAEFIGGIQRSQITYAIRNKISYGGWRFEDSCLC